MWRDGLLQAHAMPCHRQRIAKQKSSQFSPLVCADFIAFVTNLYNFGGVCVSVCECDFLDFCRD